MTECGNITSMTEKALFITVQHFGEPRVAEDEDYRLGVVGPSQVERPAERDPLAANWEEQYSSEERAPRTPDAGLAPAESPQPVPVQGVLSEESPVLP